MLNSKGIVELEPMKIEPTISIPLEEYKELLVYKGKYLALREVKYNESENIQRI